MKNKVNAEKVKVRILLAENDVDQRKTLADVLKSKSYEVFQAATPNEAKTILDEQFIHLAMLDIRLLNDSDPNDRSGLELCRNMNPAVARILITGFRDVENVREALLPSGGHKPIANSYLSKEGDKPERILEEIQRVLGEHFEIIPHDRIAVLTSGGDSPGMNAAMWAVVRTAMANSVEVLGIEDGYRGLMEGRVHKLRWNEMTPHMTRSGTILGTARCPDFKDPSVRQKAMRHLLEAHVSGLIVIGGDGSMQGAQALAEDISEGGRTLHTVAIPGTIDNDLYGTDMSLGAGSAANAIVNELQNMVPPAHAMRRIFVCEVMGRYSGFLALEAGVCFGADAILIPEQVIRMRRKNPEEVDIIDSEKELHRQLDSIATRLASGFCGGQRHALLVVSEGIGKYMEKKEGELLDEIKRYLQQRIGDWPKNLRPDIRTQVLGYLVRGVPPERFDLRLGITLGDAAVKALLKGKTNVMVGWSYKKGVIETPFELVVEKSQASQRSPRAGLTYRPKWRHLVQLHKTMVLPPGI